MFHHGCFSSQSFWKADRFATGPKSDLSQGLNGEGARPAQQSIQNFNGSVFFAKDRLNLGHTFGNFRPVKGIPAFGLQFARPLRFG